MAGPPRGPSGQGLAARAHPAGPARQTWLGPARGTGARCKPGVAMLKQFRLFQWFFGLEAGSGKTMRPLTPSAITACWHSL